MKRHIIIASLLLIGMVAFAQSGDEGIQVVIVENQEELRNFEFTDARPTLVVAQPSGEEGQWPTAETEVGAKKKSTEKQSEKGTVIFESATLQRKQVAPKADE